MARLDRLTREFGEGCLSESGDLARHISTVEAAKDMDILRAALGERQLDYLGASYGTFLGATYADLFPKHVRRMVLDGAIDPSLSNEELSLGQAKGFETALRAYLKDCVEQGNCILGETVDAGAKRIRQLLDDIDASPLPTSSDRELTEGLALYGIILPLYVKEYWPLLTVALKQAIDGRGDRLLTLADQYASRGPDGYTDNSIEAIYAVNCLDHNDYIPSSEVPSHFADFAEGLTHLRPRLRLRALDVRLLAGEERQPHQGARRGRRTADRGGRYDARPGHAVPAGSHAGPPARVGRAGQP